MSSPGGTMKFLELGKLANSLRTLHEQLELATLTALVMVLATNYVQPRFIFCCQHQWKGFVNKVHKHSLTFVP